MTRAADELSKAEIEKLIRDLDIRVREVETVNGHVRELMAALATRAAEIEELNAKVVELRTALERRGGEVEQLHGALERRGTDVERRGAEVEQLHGAIERRGAEVEQLQAALAQRAAEVEKLHARIAEGESALAVRASEVERLNADVARLRADLGTRAREVETLARALNARAREADDMGQALTMAAAPTTAPAASPRAAPSIRTIARRFDLWGLVWTIVRTDLKIRYHGTLGGVLWALLKPMATLGVLLTVFGWLFAASSDYALKLIIGIVLWEFFAEGTKVGLLSLAAKGHLVGRAVFPRWIVVATSLANPMVPLVVFSVALAGALAVGGRPPRLATALAFVWCVVQLTGIVLGLSLAMSVLFVRYRDLNQFWEVTIQAGFFLAPIVYPLEIVPEGLRKWLRLWPPTAAIEYARAALLEQKMPPAETQWVLAGLTAVLLAVGIATFRRYEPTVAEHV